MPRSTLIFGKKRGERRTGSKALGRAGLGLFSAVFFTAGVISLAFIVLKLSIPEWRVNHHFVETTCRVINKSDTSDGPQPSSPAIQVRYKVNGRSLTVWSRYDITGVMQGDSETGKKMLAEFQPGEEYRCWYDPRQPESVVLVRGYTWFAWLMLLVPAAFIAVGGGGLIFAVLTWGKSSERIAATGQRPAGLDFLLPAHDAASRPYPFVPDAQDLNDSPGIELAYRLPPASGRWILSIVALVCVLWNGTVVVFANMAVNAFQRGAPDWFLTIFILPLAAVVIALVALLVRELRTAVGIGTTFVEISAHPLVPGGTYETFVTQSGRLSVKSLDMKLVCEEVATYRQGTNTRRTTRRVYEEPIVSRQEFEIRQGQPFEGRAQVRVPPTAMHSFKGIHNRIDWKIVVRCAVNRWPDFERSFPVVVLPGPAAQEGT